MTRFARRHARWLVAAAAFALVCALRAMGGLQGLEHAITDTRARLLAHQIDSDIVIVGIDDSSLAALGHWPWTRRRHADLLNRIFSGGSVPRRVFIDVDLGSPQDAAGDAALEEALQRARTPVLLPTFFSYARGAGDAPIATPPLPRFARHADPVAVTRAGATDGITRSWRNSWTLFGQPVPSIIDPGRVWPDERDILIDYSIAPSSFDYISYVALLEGRVRPETLAGKSVFIGGVAAGLGDTVMVPIHGTLPGVVVQALAAETVASGAPRMAPAWLSVVLLAAWAALAALAFRARWARNLAALAALAAGIIAVAWYAFARERLWLDIAAPLLIVILCFGAAMLRTLDRQSWRALTYALGMRRRDTLLKSIVESSADCIVCIDERGIVRTANPAASRLFGCAAYQLIDEPIAKFIALFAGEGTSARLASLHGEVRECDARTLAGEVFPVEVCVSRIRLNPERLFTACVRDIRERRAQQRRLQHQATHDSLTMLPNRAALMAHLQGTLAASLAPRVVLLMLDLCRFKEVNDTLGHGVGDRVLCDVAQRFAQTLGQEGFIARIGGDEFTVVLDNAQSSEAVARTSQALADCLRSPIDVAGISIEVGVSIGIARFPEDAADAQSLLRQADVAMYSAKRRGTAFEYYDAANDENTVRRLAIGGELRAAIAGDALELHFQPQVNLRSGLVESCEALVRWFHPVQGAIAPSEFISIAETTDLIRPLTEWTLARALEQVRDWRARGVHVRVAVNLSARLLQDTAFPAHLELLLATSAVPATSLELEITESAMMIDPARALRVIQDIDRLGVLISIDDFGTGYSSLGYLRDLPVHALKLDRSFVMGMRASPDDRIIVESTARMAHALRIELVAEGVETEWDARLLAAAGYDFAQGFRYCGALPADQCFAWIAQYNAAAMVAAGETAQIRRAVVPGPDFRELELAALRASGRREAQR